VNARREKRLFRNSGNKKRAYKKQEFFCGGNAYTPPKRAYTYFKWLSFLETLALWACMRRCL